MCTICDVCSQKEVHLHDCITTCGLSLRTRCNRYEWFYFKEDARELDVVLCAFPYLLQVGVR